MATAMMATVTGAMTTKMTGDEDDDDGGGSRRAMAATDSMVWGVRMFGCWV